MADIKTAKINHNLSKIKNRDLKSEEFQLFLEKYGHRELEFDYYFPTWAEKPEVLMESNVTNKNHMTQKESYEIGLKTLQEVLSHVSAENFAYMYELIQLTVQFTELDDEEHFQTTRVNLLARRAAKSLGEKLKLNDPYDVFFLTKEELLMLDESFEENNELIEKLQNRRNDYQHLLETNPTWDISGEEEEEIVDPSALKGVPGSAGSVEGNIFIVKSVDEFKNVPDGAILVTRTTNPAWTTLFYNAKALITESGGPLSHGAVTAREVGIPAVMSVKNAMSILKTGDKVIVDGTHGLVKKIS
jgi:pyruvate,water dikinase